MFTQHGEGLKCGNNWVGWRFAEPWNRVSMAKLSFSPSNKVWVYMHAEFSVKRTNVRLLLKSSECLEQVKAVSR